MRRNLIAILAFASTLTAATPALADTESWNALEVRLPLAKPASLAPTSLRFATEVRYADRMDGLYQSFFRIGPIWDVHPNLSVAAHVTAAALQGAEAAFEQEHRLELEPSLRWRWGLAAFSDRNRLEYRWGSAGPRWRYRNQLWLNLAAADAQWIPFVWDEVLLDLSGTSPGGFTQNRASLGVGRMLGDTTRLNVSYVLRSRQTAASAWEHDHIALVSLLFTPDVPPLLGADE